ncbi:MAG: cardiolipin synthase [Clostridia bacterium]|nr:cardiolipin synthase [Clostridia bacterium]
MKKFLRNLFSGFFLIMLVLLLEAGIIIYIQFFFDDTLVALGVITEESAIYVLLAYVAIRIVTFVVAVVIFFKIIAKIEDPEFKIPWIVGMLLMPLFFSFLFLIFGNHGLRKKDKRIIVASAKANQRNFGDSAEEFSELEKENESAVGAFRYINNVTGLGLHTNNRVTYYKTGEEFFPALIEGLKQAEDFIFMEFFIIADGRMWDAVTDVLKQKAEEGVTVRVIYDDMGCGGTISSRTPAILRPYGIRCYKFHPFRPVLSGVYNNRDHRKIVIVDHKMAFTGGINLADEYGNYITRFGYWKDTMVKIEGSAINNLIVTFLQNYDLCKNVISRFDRYLKYDYEKFDDKGFIMPFGDGPGGIDDALIGEQTYINILNYAKKRVDISTPYLIPTYPLLDALKNAALRGVEVNLILPGIPDKKVVYLIAKSHFPFLLQAGVNIYIYKPGFNHMKSALADDELAFVGTINFDFRSLVHHFECGTLLYKNECVKAIKEDFKQMISLSEAVPKDFKLKRGQRRFCSLAKIITPLL